MKLTDLMNIDELESEIKAGYVRRRYHPLDPNLTILNYGEACQYENHWTDVTRQTRGLIIGKNDEVLARPFDKFFNVGQEQAAQIDPTTQVMATDKMDGSLGILYPGPDGWAIATRGSFESEQAIHATALLRERYADWLEPIPFNWGWTYLFEIVYPQNRIVLDYGDLDDLVLIGGRVINTGQIVGPPTLAWPGPRAQVLGGDWYITYADALKIADRTNREGIVIREVMTDTLVKVKQEDYVRLHKLVTGLNEKAVWEHLRDHSGAYGELLAAVPDEFHEWVKATAEAFLDRYEDLQGEAHADYHHILGYMQHDGPDSLAWGAEERKTFAGLARETRHPQPLFQMLDGRDISPWIWKTLKPKGETPSLLNRSEDTA